MKSYLKKHVWEKKDKENSKGKGEKRFKKEKLEKL